MSHFRGREDTGLARDEDDTSVSALQHALEVITRYGLSFERGHGNLPGFDLESGVSRYRLFEQDRAGMSDDGCGQTIYHIGFSSGHSSHGDCCITVESCDVVLR